MQEKTSVTWKCIMCTISKHESPPKMAKENKQDPLVPKIWNLSCSNGTRTRISRGRNARQKTKAPKRRTKVIKWNGDQVDHGRDFPRGPTGPRKPIEHGPNRLEMEIDHVNVCWKGVLWKFLSKIQIKMENFDVKNGNYGERKALIYIKQVESGNFAQEQV